MNDRSHDPVRRGGHRLLGLPGSLRRASYNLRLLEAARDHAPPGVAITIYDDLASIPLPFSARNPWP